ncbi:SpoIID/LytB domain-containing protein [Nocardioides sp. CER19]|uniref:SpoIID/LytB domain-containing protein n=1 Tax=Nocardioides sp. CER19 TaxID=3038538 RepID=UPI00244B3BF4|nr:SpoIID/LytB domain-containing protein [Nocardioides sp. CER19]MDH2412545.1 SpoIID/LytB domain-containing protein [Nocardioides sp. CER19]
MPFARHPLRALAVSAGLATGLTLAVAPSAHADSTFTVPAGATSVTVNGEGSGHGHGLSQYGANAAAKRGLSTDQILRHYYPGTANGTAGGQVRVLLSSRPTLVVGTRKGLVASVVGGRRFRLTHVSSSAARKAKRWMIAPVSATRTRLAYRKGGHWKTFRVVTGELQFSAGGAPITLYAGADRGTFRGTLRSARPSATSADRDIVNVLPLEAYVKGVVPNEMPALWAPAAVRAQAIAARTYAVHERVTVHRGYFDVYDTTQSQVYRGAGSEQAASSRAVDATRSRILTYAGRPAYTQFTSSNGGYMLANAAAPYLVSGRDVYDPVRTWSKAISVSALKGRFLPNYPLGSITVTTYPNAGGWVHEVVVSSSDGVHANTIPAETFRTWAGLKSGSFRIAG